jgi:hypothetical protein
MRHFQALSFRHVTPAVVPGYSRLLGAKICAASGRAWQRTPALYQDCGSNILIARSLMSLRSVETCLSLQLLQPAALFGEEGRLKAGQWPGYNPVEGGPQPWRHPSWCLRLADHDNKHHAKMPKTSDSCLWQNSKVKSPVNEYRGCMCLLQHRCATLEAC